jgi:hypothetical protein
MNKQFLIRTRADSVKLKIVAMFEIFTTSNPSMLTLTHCLIRRIIGKSTSLYFSLAQINY